MTVGIGLGGCLAFVSLIMLVNGDWLYLWVGPVSFGCGGLLLLLGLRARSRLNGGDREA